MSSKRLVVLDEQDYKSLIEKSRQPPAQSREEITSEEPQTQEPLPPAPEKQKETPEPEKVQPAEEEATPVDPPKETTPEPVSKRSEPVEEQEADIRSPLDTVLDGLTKGARAPALKLLDKLSKLQTFDYDIGSGQIVLNGKPVENYSLQRFLKATCEKSGAKSLPAPLGRYLLQNGLKSFRNKGLKLGLKAKWRNLYS